ncbi:MAG: hypothetical protein AB4911_04575 [Oscillochloridaceae bacterium umkhey_bin13]
MGHKGHAHGRSHAHPNSGLYQEGYGNTVNPRNNAFQWDGYGMPLTSGYKRELQHVEQ